MPTCIWFISHKKTSDHEPNVYNFPPTFLPVNLPTLTPTPKHTDMQDSFTFDHTVLAFGISVEDRMVGYGVALSAARLAILFWNIEAPKIRVTTLGIHT